MEDTTGSSEPVKCRICRKREATIKDLCDQCRNAFSPREIHKGSLPWFYRLLLRLPGVGRIEKASGFFWVIVVPILVFLNALLSLVLLFLFPFPLNILLVAIVPASLLVLFVRLGLERFINLWNLVVVASAVEWNIEKSTREYAELLKSQGRGKKTESPSGETSKAKHEQCD